MASISPQARDALVAIHIGMFNAPPGASVLSQMVLDYESGKTLKEIAAGFSSNANFRSQYPSFLTAEEFADRMVANFLGDNADQATKDWSKQYVIGRLNAGVPDTEVIVLAVNALRAATNPDFAVAQTQIENKLEVAKYYAIDLEQDSSDYAVLRSIIANVTEEQASRDQAITTIGDAVQTFSLAAGAASVNEGGSVSFTLSTSKVPAGTNIAYTISGVNAADVDGALTGTAVVDSNGKATITVKLLNDLSTEGAETVTVSLDNGKANASATVNDTSLSPVYTVTAGAASANEGDTITFAVSADTAVNGTATVTIAGITAADVEELPTSVTLVDGKGTITLVLKSDITTEGSETVSVTVGSSTATTTVADTSVAPVLGTDAAAGTIVSGQGTAIVTPASLLANDFGSDGKAIASDTAVSLVAGSATNGEVFITKEGNFLFVAASGERTGSFKYTVAGQEGEGTVNVTLNTAPTVTVTDLTVAEDTAINGTVTVVDGDNDTVTYTYSAKNGTVTDNGDGKFSYKGNANFNGSDTVTVTVNDGYTTVSKDIAVTVSAVDDAPSKVDPAPATVDLKSGSTITVDLSKYATDVDSASLTYTADAGTTTNGATVTINGSIATINYSSVTGAGTLGADSFKFTATDGTTPVSGVVVNLNVTNTAPTSNNLALDAKTGVTQTVDLSSAVSDADGNTLTPTVKVGSLSAGGSAEVLNGKIVYTSTVGYTGTETLTYYVEDAFGGKSNESTITFTVKANTGGTSLADLLYGSSSAEVIDGLAGNDTINGGGGLDTITGGDGNDQVTFSDAAVQILGAAGIDTLVINSDAVATAFDLSQSTQQMVDTSSKNGNNNSVVVRTFENIDASKSSGNFLLNVDTSAGAYAAESGGDSVSTTSIKSGSGNDHLNFTRATGSVTVESGDGNDTIFVNNAGTTAGSASGTFSIDGGAGNDTINFSATTAAQTINGGAGNDTVTVGTGSDSVAGGAGNDRFVYNGNLSSLDTVAGGDGTDTIVVNAALNDTVYTNVSGVEVIELAAAGDNTIGAKAQAAGVVSVVGAGGSETIGASAYTVGLTVSVAAAATGTSIQTGTGNDTFVFDNNELGSTATINGGTGTDTISFNNSVAHTATLDFDDLTNIESVVYSDADGAGTSTEAHALTIEAAASTTNTITIDASAITDTSDTVNITNSAGTAQKFSITGGAGGDTLNGADGNDTINGGGGNDTIGTANGNNTVDGGTGNDTITVGTGNDSVSGGDGNDTFTFAGNLTSNDTVAGGAGTDTINVTADVVDTTFTNVTTVETLGLTGADATLGTTAQGAGIVTVNAAGGGTTVSASAYTVGLTLNFAAAASGGSIITGSGNDSFVFDDVELTSTVTLNGGSGSDTIKFNNAAAHTATLDFDDLTNIERVEYTDADGAGTSAEANALTIEAAASTTNTITIDASAITATNDTLNITNSIGSAQKFSITGGAGNDTLNGSDGADTINGGTGNDTIGTGNGANVVDGGAGNDSITVGTGTDNVTGGDGNDSFIFAGNMTSGDTIAGGAGTDTLSVSSALVDTDFNNVTGVETLTLTGTVSTTLGSAAQAAGITTYNGNGGAETLSATAYTVALTVNLGSVGAAKFETGSGDDIFIAATTEYAGTATMDGNGGNDTLRLDNAAGAYTATIDMDSLEDIEKIDVGDADGTGTGAAETLTITLDAITETTSQTVDLDFSKITDSTDEVAITNSAASSTTKWSITGGAGGDTLVGSTGADTISGGGGADSLTGGGGNDSVVGGAGADTIVSGQGSDTITLGSGSDTDADVVAFDKTTLITAISTVTDFDARTSSTSEDIISVGAAGNDASHWSASATVTQSTATTATDARLVVLDSQSYATVGDAANAADNLHTSTTAGSFHEYLFVWTDSNGDVRVSWARQDSSGAVAEGAVDQYTDLVKLTGVSISNINLGDFDFAA